MTRLILSPRALADLNEIATWLLTEASRGIAQRFADDFEHVFERLSEYPGSGAPRPRLGRDMRIVPVWPYVVIYRHALGEETATVVRVVHGRRRITRRLVGEGSG